MIGVGCDSVMPGVPGANLPSVFYVKTMEDGLLFERIAHLNGVNEVVIVGGGYIGVEMAEAMLHLQKKVTLVEAADRLLTPFEPEFSEMAAQELERKGVTLKLRERVTERRRQRLVEVAGGRRVARHAGKSVARRVARNVAR